MRGRAIAVALSVALVPLFALESGAATRRCFGKEASIVSSKGTIRGTAKADVIVATGATEKFIYGLGGNDRICTTGARNNVVSGGPGADKLGGNGNYLIGGPGDDLLVGDNKDGSTNDLDYADYTASRSGIEVDVAQGVSRGEGTDKLVDIDGVFGTNHDDVLKGHEGRDDFWGLEGDDVIIGGDGFDRIEPGPGSDQADGGGGIFDFADYRDSDSAVTIDFAEGTATGEGDDQLTGFEVGRGSSFDDTILGSEADNWLYGGPGNDTIDGRDGYDYFFFWYARGPVAANLQLKTSVGEQVLNAEGTDVGEGNDSLENIEGLSGTFAYDDTLTGDAGDNFLDGDGGADTIEGGAGDDWIVGGYNGTGDDVVNGGPGNYDFWDFYGPQSLNGNLVTGTIDGGSFVVQIDAMEAIGGGDSPDVFVGDDGVNYFFGWGGIDQINTGAGDDQADGGAGEDIVDMGVGADRCVPADFTDGGEVLNCEDWTNPVTMPPLQIEATNAATFRRNI